MRPALEKHKKFGVDLVDSVTLLTPCDERGQPTGAHPGKSFIDGVKMAFDVSHKHYKARVERVRSIHDLSVVLSREAGAGRRFPVRGRPNRSGVIRRTCAIGPKKKPHLDDIGHRWVMLDFDGLPNLWGIDPAGWSTEIAGRVRWMLPGDLSRAACHYEMSSSARMVEVAPKVWRPLPVGQSPQFLRLHLWFWMSEVLTTEPLKRILRAVDAAVHATLAERGADIPGKFPDAKIAEAHMPHYVAQPRFGPGDHDGMELVDRIGFLEGDIDVVDVATLPREIPRAARAPKAAFREKTATKPSARQPRMPVAPARVIPLARARDLLGVFNEAPERTRGESYKHWCQNALFPSRALYEMIAIAQDNRESRTGWEGGVPEGLRNDWMSALAALAIERMPLALSDADLRARLRMVAQAAGICLDWLDTEWVAQGYDTACIGRYRELSDAGGTWTRSYAGRPCPATYRYRKSSLVPLAAATADQVQRLKITSVALLDDVREADRRAAGVRSQQDLRAEARQKDTAVQALAADGLSQREIMERLGLTRGSVVRALARPLAPKQVVLDAEVAKAADMPASEAPAASKMATAIDTLGRCLASTQGVDDPEGLSEALGEPLGAVLAAMERLEMPTGRELAEAA